jgi:hypothetical protein
MLPRFRGLATGAYRPVRPGYAPVPGRAPEWPAGTSGSAELFWALWAQTVSAVPRTAQVARMTKIANQTTMPITLTSATLPTPITSVLILTIW